MYVCYSHAPELSHESAFKLSELLIFSRFVQKNKLLLRNTGDNTEKFIDSYNAFQTEILKHIILARIQYFISISYFHIKVRSSVKHKIWTRRLTIKSKANL